MDENSGRTVALLGTGIMGAAMGRNLLKHGFRLRAWNRSADKARPLVDAGAQAAASPAEAVRGADLVLTMLADGPAVEAVLREALAGGGAGSGAVLVQCSTVGVEYTARLEGLAREAGLAFVDAPVLGTRQPAEAGQLTVLASGEDAALARCRPLFDAVASRTLELGAAGAGTRLKLVVNGWIVGLLGTLAESLAVSRAVGVPEGRLLEVIAGGPLDAGYAQLKGKQMLARSYPPSFPLSLALKDARLVREAAQAAGVSLPVMEGVIRDLERAEAAGHGGDDMAAIAEGVGR
jgi:3-hydroxyisobutyrate dehydrogenase